MQPSLAQRYESFATEAGELLSRVRTAEAGDGVSPRLGVRTFLVLAKAHFPEDAGWGNGPVGVLLSLEHELAGVGTPYALEALVCVVRSIINNRPPVFARSDQPNARAVGHNCPFFDTERNYGSREDAVFVLMPFREPWSDAIWRKLQDWLGRTADGTQLSVARADAMYGQDVMEDVFEGIVRSRLVIAECTRRNPNVLYELGLVHALGKRTVLLSQNEDDIPFDLRRFRFCIYNDDEDGHRVLKHFLRETVREVFADLACVKLQ